MDCFVFNTGSLINQSISQPVSQHGYSHLPNCFYPRGWYRPGGHRRRSYSPQEAFRDAEDVQPRLYQLRLEQ
jgi:hypothetical protein